MNLLIYLLFLLSLFISHLCLLSFCFYLAFFLCVFLLFLGSAEAFVNFDIQSWNYPPVVPESTSLYVLNRKPMVIDLIATDVSQGQFIELYITGLPTKGNKMNIYCIYLMNT